MAIRLNATGDTLDLTAGLPLNSSFTIMLDTQIVSNIGATVQPIFWALNGGFTDGYSVVWENASGLMAAQSYFSSTINDVNTFPSRPDVGRPFCMFAKCKGGAGTDFEVGWKYPGAPWVRIALNLSTGIAQVSTLWFGGVLATYYSDKRIQNIKIWDRPLSDGELMREGDSEGVLFKTGLNSYFPLPHLGDPKDRGPKGKTLARGGTMETEYFAFPRYKTGRRLIAASAPAAGGTFQILAGRRFSLAGARGLAG